MIRPRKGFVRELEIIPKCTRLKNGTSGISRLA